MRNAYAKPSKQVSGVLATSTKRATTQKNVVLTPTNHDRDIAGLTYVYPVVSRRAGGVSVGVNLNPNNACNWACVYCQVPNLVRGTAPPIDLAQLEMELRAMLHAIVHGDFMQTQVPEDMRRLNDIALSGNGEPTSAREFEAVIELIGRLLTEFDLFGKIKLVLITNGSLLSRKQVQAGLRTMAELNGEVWFKLDSATAAGMRTINQTRIAPDKAFERIKISATLCATWLQTCVFARDGVAPSEAEHRLFCSWCAVSVTPRFRFRACCSMDWRDRRCSRRRRVCLLYLPFGWKHSQHKFVPLVCPSR